MARHRTAARKHEETAPMAAIDEPQMPGGAAGVPGAEATLAPDVEEAQRQREDPERQAEAPKYMVVDGPRAPGGAIKYYSQGYMAQLQPGKIVQGGTHNLEEMRKQGIRLERVPDIVEEAQQATA